MRYFILILILSTFLVACETPTSPKVSSTPDRAQQIVDQAIDYHGGASYEQLDLSYTFRKRDYRLQNDGTVTFLIK